MAGPEMPIFTRTFDFLTWLLPATNDFPRAHRFTATQRFSATQRLLNAAFDLRLAIHPTAHPLSAAKASPPLDWVVTSRAA